MAAAAADSGEEFDAGEEEPLFADDLDELEDEDDPPPLPPPLQGPGSASRLTTLADHEGLRVGLGVRGLPDRARDQSAGDGPRRRGRDEDQDGNQEQAVKRKRKPLLSLNADILFSERGIPYLAKEFPKIRFKGKGHEASDLKKLLQEYEQWANAIYPKLTFHDFTQRVEKLGSNNKDFRARFMMLRRRAGGLPDIRRDDEEEEREIVDEGGELRGERDREHEDNGGGVGEHGGQRDSERENNGGGVEGDNGQTEQLENCDSLVARESSQSLEMPLNGMNNELAGGDVTNESNDSRTEQLAARDIAENEEDVSIINDIGEEEEDVPLINSIGEENVRASIRHMAELMEEEEEEVPLIIAEDEEMEENASFEGVDSNREEANPIVCQGMASDEEGNVAAVTLTESSEENEEEELTELS